MQTSDYKFSVALVLWEGTPRALRGPFPTLWISIIGPGKAVFGLYWGSLSHEELQIELEMQDMNV